MTSLSRTLTKRTYCCFTVSNRVFAGVSHLGVAGQVIVQPVPVDLHTVLGTTVVVRLTVPFPAQIWLNITRIAENKINIIY